MKWFRLLSVIFLMLVMLLFTSPVAYADEPTAGESNVVTDICVTGATEVHVTASDGSHINVGAHGAREAHMHFTADADTVFDVCVIGDGEADIDVSGPCEVNVKVEGPAKVNIDASDEVKLNIEASDESQVFLDDHSLDNPAQKLDEPAGYHGSVVPVISGAFPAAGLLALFLIRRRAKNNINKGDDQLTKPQEEEVKK
jgi:MYXO-CTERM domain-containing protein